jgi:diguanylate cyclase (GGDEF)-like protein
MKLGAVRQHILHRRAVGLPSWGIRIWLLNGCMASAAATLFSLVRDVPAIEAPLTVPWWTLAVLFFLAESYIVHLELRRDAHSFSLTDVPLVVGLFLASPAALIASQTAGITLALLVRRQPPAKLIFNVANVSLSGGIAALVFHAFVVPTAPLGPGDWGATFVAMFPAVVVSVSLINLAMKLTGAELQRSVWTHVLGLSVAVTFTNTSIALAAVTIVWIDVRAVWLLLLPIAMMFLTYRAYTSQRQRHHSLEVLYKATRVVDRSVRLDSGTSALLEQTRDMFRAEMAELTLFGENLNEWARRSTLGPGDHVDVDSPVTLEPTEGVWARIASERQALLFPRPIENARLRDYFAARGIRDAMVAPLYRDGEVVGTLLVGNRLGDVSTFDTEDLKLFEMLSNHASVSLDNARLVEDLSSSLAQLKDLNRRNEYQATHDALTGLPNRLLFHHQVRDCISAGRDGPGAAVMMIDLDRFKEVNDTLGHHNGDVLLEQVAVRLTDGLRSTDTVARLGGDEFAVLLPDVRDAEAAYAVARDLRKALEEPLVVAGLSLSLGASIGIAVHPFHGGDVHELLRKADVAMYAAKERETLIEIYSSDYDSNSAGRLGLAGELRRAIDEHQLTLHYQPKARIADGTVTGVEALVRWAHPERGPVRPDEFIPVAESSGLIKPLTLYVLDAAVRQCRTWVDQGLDLKVAVNLSAKNLIDLGFADEVGAILQKWNVSPSQLELEITESTIMSDPARARNVLGKLNAMGIGLAIDDFGTGYSSLGYLKRLPVDELKIDKSFVLNMTTERSDAAIVRSTVELGHNLGLKVVAEGVENHEVWAELQDVGCDLAQGYLLSRPLPATELESWLASRDRFEGVTLQPARRKGLVLAG